MWLPLSGRKPGSISRVNRIALFRLWVVFNNGKPLHVLTDILDSRIANSTQ